MRADEPVVTEVAVCFAPAADVFVVRYVVRWRNAEGAVVTGTFRSALTRFELIRESGGPELADWLVAHPYFWWRMPMRTRVEEGYAA